MLPTKLVLWSCLAGAFAVLADRNITVDDFDSRIVYTGPWRHENSGATFDRFNRTTSYTFQAAASASLKFNGTGVYFIGYGVPPPEKDTYQVTLDGQNEVHSLRVGVNDTRAKFMGYWRSGLDASKEHTITISNLQGTFSNIDAFIVTVLDNSTMKDGFATEAPTSDEQPGGQPGLNTNAIVGIVVAVVGVSVGLLGALGVYLWRRNNRAGILRRSINVEGGTPFSQSAGARDATLAHVSPFEWVASGPPTQHEGVRKDGRPHGAINGAHATRSEPSSPPPYPG